MQQPDGIEKSIAILEPQKMFGEAALLHSAHLYATARALTPCHLLLLDRDALLELMSREADASETLMSLMAERSRPMRVENIIYHQRTTADKQIITTLKNTMQKTYFQLTEEGWFIWQQLNGKKTLQEMSLAFYQQFGRMDPEMVSNTIIRLAEMGFAYLDVSKAQYSAKRISQTKPSILYQVFNAR